MKGERVVLFGSEGWLGQLFKLQLPGVAAVRTDITNSKDVGKLLDQVQPSIVINCAGKTGRPNIDWCEDHPVETMSVNVAGPIILATECAKRQIRMVHLGSGCIYQGTGPGYLGNQEGYSETDPPNFRGSLYSRSKILSEEALDAFSGVLQLRLRMPFDGSGHPRCLITKLVNYRSIIDVPNSVTWVSDLVTTTLELIRRERIGIWNIVNPGAVRHSEILDLYREIVDPSFTYETILVGTLLQRVKAERSNCVLSTKKLEEEGIRLTPAKEALRQALGVYRRREDARS